MKQIISHERLAEVVGALPAYELVALKLLDEHRMPTTPEELEQFAAATEQIVEYGQRCEKAADALKGLQAIPAQDTVLVEEFPL